MNLFVDFFQTDYGRIQPWFVSIIVSPTVMATCWYQYVPMLVVTMTITLLLLSQKLILFVMVTPGYLLLLGESVGTLARVPNWCLSRCYQMQSWWVCSWRLIFNNNCNFDNHQFNTLPHIKTLVHSANNQYIVHESYSTSNEPWLLIIHGSSRLIHYFHESSSSVWLHESHYGSLLSSKILSHH